MPQDKNTPQSGPGQDIATAIAGFRDPDAMPHPRAPGDTPPHWDPETEALLLRERRPGESWAQTARRLFGELAMMLPQDVVDHVAAESWAERREDEP